VLFVLHALAALVAALTGAGTASVALTSNVRSATVTRDFIRLV
jgi:hypothetical protein